MFTIDLDDLEGLIITAEDGRHGRAIADLPIKITYVERAGRLCPCLVTPEPSLVARALEAAALDAAAESPRRDGFMYGPTWWMQFAAALRDTICDRSPVAQVTFPDLHLDDITLPEDGPDVWARFDPFGRLTRTSLTREPDDEHGIWERVSRDDADRARREQE